jgi:cell division protein FtsL
MKATVCFFIALAACCGIIFLTKAFGATDTVKIAITQVDSNKTPTTGIWVDKEVFSTALNSSNATIEFLKWFLNSIMWLFAFIIAAATAYFTWRAYQDNTKIKSLETKAATVEASFKALQEQIQQQTDNINAMAGEIRTPPTPLNSAGSITDDTASYTPEM